jgi:hypothetical protein
MDKSLKLCTFRGIGKDDPGNALAIWHALIVITFRTEQSDHSLSHRRFEKQPSGDLIGIDDAKTGLGQNLGRRRFARRYRPGQSDQTDLPAHTPTLIGSRFGTSIFFLPVFATGLLYGWDSGRQNSGCFKEDTFARIL